MKKLLAGASTLGFHAMVLDTLKSKWQGQQKKL